MNIPRGYNAPPRRMQDPETGVVVSGYAEPFLSAIRAGYMCGACGEGYGGIWHPRCPVCNTVPQFVDEPDQWVDNIGRVESGKSYGDG